MLIHQITNVIRMKTKALIGGKAPEGKRDGFRNMLCALDSPDAIEGRLRPALPAIPANMRPSTYCREKSCMARLSDPTPKETYLLPNRMAERLESQKKSGHIQGEHWYRNFADWVLISVNNPVHYRHPNSELVLLASKREAISPLVSNTLQVHYGVGVGETELELVRWQLEKCRDVEVAAIDANRTFLDLFLSNLRSRKIETSWSRISFKGFNDVFQSISPDDLSFANSVFFSKTHICLGGTIGNFKPQEEIFGIFSKLAAKHDKLVLGFHLDTHIDAAFSKYSRHPHYPSFVLNWMDRAAGGIEPSKISWDMDRRTGYITMHYQGIGEVFRTRRYKVEQVKEEASKSGFRMLGNWLDEYKDACIAVFEKT